MQHGISNECKYTKALFFIEDEGKASKTGTDLDVAPILPTYDTLTFINYDAASVD
ncbi:MAG: hypothetical protein ACUVQP_03555 [Bacteroidales bacterium]